MGAGSAVLSKGLRELEAGAHLNFDAFRTFMGTHFKPGEHEELFRELAAANNGPGANAAGANARRQGGAHISVAQLKDALDDQLVAAKLWRQFKKTWDGGPDWELVKKLLKSRPSAIRVRDYEVKTVPVNKKKLQQPEDVGADGGGAGGEAGRAGDAGSGKGTSPASSPKSAEAPAPATSPSSSSSSASSASSLSAASNPNSTATGAASAGATRVVVLRRTMLDVAVEFAVTREYRLDLNALSLMHECWPELILQRNADGDNPLHVAVATWPRSPTDVAVSLVEICPKAAKERDGRGRLPLAAALEKGTADELVMALAMADADSVYLEEVQRADLMHGSRLEHVLRSGQIEARREIELRIDSGLQYPKATWIRLGSDFDVRSIVEDFCDDWRKEAADETLAATKGVFLPPISKAKPLKTYLKCAELAFVGPQLQGEFSKRYMHDFLSPLLEAGRGFLEDEIKWADGHKALLKQVFDVLRLRLVKLEWKTREVMSSRDNFRPYEKRPGFQDLVQKTKFLYLHSDAVENGGAFEQSATDIPTLYTHAFKCHPRMDKLVRGLAARTRAHAHLAPLKSIYRVLERTAFVEDQALQWDCSGIVDVVRGVLEFAGESALERILTCLDVLYEHPDIQIIFVDEHLARATEGGWFDLKVYLTFLDDANRHVCELQFVEESIKTIRKSLGSTGDVDEFKAAKELLIATGNADLVNTPAPLRNVPKGESTEHRLLLETVDALMMEARSKAKLLTASKSVIQEKERVIVLRDQEIERLQRELTKIKRKNDALLAAAKARPGSGAAARPTTPLPESELARETARKAGTIKLDRNGS